MLKRTAEDFRKAAHKHKITAFPLRNCGLCGYETKYIIRGDEVSFDPGCYCVQGSLEQRSWQDLARHYNMQSHPSYIARLDAFWHFGAEPED